MKTACSADMPDIAGARHDMAARADRVLVVIPTLNEAAHIAATLRALVAPCNLPVDHAPLDQAHKPPQDALCIVVVDGGSTDETRSIVQALQADDHRLHLLDNPDRLQSAGINHAVARFGQGYDILVRCDAHAVYPPGYVADVAKALRATKAASLVVPMDAIADPQQANPFQRAAAWVVDTPFGSGGSAHRGGKRSGLVDHGHHAGMDLQWFTQIGGYDPAFSHNEDAEYDYRLWQAGGLIWLEAGIRLAYVMRPTPRALARQYWFYGRGRARTIRKHAMRPRLRQLVPVANLLGIGLSLFLAPVWPWTLLWPAAYLCAIAGIALLGIRALGGVSGLWAGVALLIMHNAWAAGFLRQIGRRA